MNRANPPAPTDHESNDARDCRLDAVVTAYVESCERGELPLAAEWISRHPELAPDLADFLASFDTVDKAFARLRALAAPWKPNR
jgi:hypothetical protein